MFMRVYTQDYSDFLGFEMMLFLYFAKLYEIRSS
jgi:hypothetical protein